MADEEMERFRTLYRLADKLIAQADKEDVAETARILAFDLAQYQVSGQLRRSAGRRVRVFGRCG